MGIKLQEQHSKVLKTVPAGEILTHEGKFKVIICCPLDNIGYYHTTTKCKRGVNWPPLIAQLTLAFLPLLVEASRSLSSTNPAMT
jgi:hypothetical protein